MHQSITLNIHYALPGEAWQKVMAIYPLMPGWIGYPDEGCPYWFGTEGDEKFLVASIEPSGLAFGGKMEAAEFTGWINAFIEKATQALGFQVIDADEAGEYFFN